MRQKDWAVNSLMVRELAAHRMVAWRQEALRIAIGSAAVRMARVPRRGLRARHTGSALAERKGWAACSDRRSLAGRVRIGLAAESID